MVKTRDNTRFFKWWEAAHSAFEDAGLRGPRMGEARDAYEVGESPETFRDWILGGVGLYEWNASEPGNDAR